LVIYRRQIAVALSTTEAEYMALSLAASEALWLRQLLKKSYTVTIRAA